MLILLSLKREDYCGGKITAKLANYLPYKAQSKIITC